MLNIQGYTFNYAHDIAQDIPFEPKEKQREMLIDLYKYLKDAIEAVEKDLKELQNE